jgi:hypothetical protein
MPVLSLQGAKGFYGILREFCVYMRWPSRKIHGPNVTAHLEKDFCLFKPLIRHTIELSRNRPCWCTHLMRS